MDVTATPPALHRGAHTNPAEGMCLMEYVALRAGHGFTDHPDCCHPALAALARGVNDRVSDRARPRLARLEPALRGTDTACPGATEVVVATCARRGLELAPDDRRLARLPAGLPRPSSVDGHGAGGHGAGGHGAGGHCAPTTDRQGGVRGWYRRRRAAYRLEMAIFDSLSAIVTATAPGARRDAVLTDLLIDVVEEHRARCPALDPVAVELPEAAGRACRPHP